jgi:hypothetical protein
VFKTAAHLPDDPRTRTPTHVTLDAPSGCMERLITKTVACRTVETSN